MRVECRAIEVDCRGDKKELVKVIESTEWLAVHEHLDDKTLYTVSHIPTGRQVVSSGTQEGALAIMKRLSQVGIDWDFNDLKDQKLEKARAICDFVLGTYRPSN